MFFISFYCLFILTKTATRILNTNGKSWHPCLVLILEGKTNIVSLLNMMLVTGFVDDLYQVEVPFYLFIEYSLNKKVLDLSNTFSVSICQILSLRWLYGFVLFSINMIYYSNWFSKDFHCILGHSHCHPRKTVVLVFRSCLFLWSIKCLPLLVYPAVNFS